MKRSTVELEPATYDEEGNELTPAVTRQKTLAEFSIFSRDLGDGTTLFKLSALEYDHGRKDLMTEEDMTDWDNYLTPYGFPSDTWKTNTEAVEILSALETEEM